MIFVFQLRPQEDQVLLFGRKTDSYSKLMEIYDFNIHFTFAYVGWEYIEHGTIYSMLLFAIVRSVLKPREGIKVFRSWFLYLTNLDS